MYFEITRKELLPSLKMIIGVVEQRQTLPVLANTLVCVKDKRLHLTATDAEVEIVCCLPLESGMGTENDGETTLPARKFFDVCKSLSDDIVIQADINENQANLNAGKNKFTLQTLPAEDFPNSPQLSEPAEFHLSQNKLKTSLQKTSFCVATNDVRYYLTGLLLEIGEGKISFVGTDGHRMAVTQHDFESDQTASVIIPRKGVVELSKMLTNSDSEVKVLVDDNHIRFEISDSLAMSSKLIDGRFPDWNTVIPSNLDKIVVADTGKMKQAFSCASILSNEKYKGVRLALTQNNLRVTGKNSSHEEALAVVDLEYNGEDLEIGFNGIYLSEAINAISTETVQIAFGDSNSSCLITEEGNEDSKFIVMPMRL
ncbi:MAG: DNA polymerase III subunit beta [Pseudomonadota bacterium]